jgi:hypothetical protein
MNFTEYIKMPKGFLEVVVTDHYTGELIYRDPGKNQIQDWARHSLAYLSAGRLFCNWGNHGEPVTDVGSYTINHYKDGLDGDDPGDIITNSPWTYDSSFSGLIQLRDVNGDLSGISTTNGAPLYPFFPTKMRFGIGGLDPDQNPRTDIDKNVTQLQTTIAEFPFIVVSREKGTPEAGESASEEDHIYLDQTTLSVNHTVRFSCKLPGGGSAYPYDGYVLSEAGLFCDAGLTAPGNDYNMRTGIMWAYRTFYGITKNESIDVTFNWTFVF